jgi:hypothetical protein
VLGAGASRGVSYAETAALPSPLDYDFFDLLQRLNRRKRDRKAVKDVLEDVAALPRKYWRSFERAFYTLQLRAYLSKKLKVEEPYKRDSRIVTDFALCMYALLREPTTRIRSANITNSRALVFSWTPNCDENE